MKKKRRKILIAFGIILAIVLSVFFLKAVLAIIGLSLIISGFLLRKEYKRNDILSTKPFWLTYSGLALLLFLSALFVGQNHTFFNVVLILLIVTVLLLLTGLIKPSVPLMFSKIKTRKRVLTVYGFTFLILFLTSGIVSPTNDVQNLTKGNNESTETGSQDVIVPEPFPEPTIPAINKPADESSQKTINPDTPVSSDNGISNQTGGKKGNNSNPSGKIAQGSNGGGNASPSNPSNNNTTNNKHEPEPEPYPEPEPSYPTDGLGPNGETIKGNINAKGEKIYYVPGTQNYEEIVAEEWFFTEEEAIAAGYKKAKK